MTDGRPARQEPAPERGRDLADQVRQVTPARVFTSRAGTSYPTSTALRLRADHAAARDAVTAEVRLDDPRLARVAREYGLFGVATRAGSPAEYLRRPDLGRTLAEPARHVLGERCPTGRDVQIVIGDGLSAAAVYAQVPALLPALAGGCAARGWSLGQPFVVHRCRVGVLNDVGALLDPAVVVLLVGERPGLATAESLSAYLAYRPRPGHTDADRNLVSNIHRHGVPVPAAADRVLGLVAQLLAAGTSGVHVKELQLPPAPPAVAGGTGQG